MNVELHESLSGKMLVLKLSGKLDKDDYHLLKYYNMLVVNRPAALFLE